MNDIILVAQNGSNVILKLNNEKKPYTVEEILDIHAKVYSDTVYMIDISCEEISEINVYINGESVESDYRDGMIYFGRENERAFAGIIGLAQISLFITYQNGETEWAYSEYASVLIRASETNKALDLMLKYVYKNQEDILHRDSRVTEIGKQYNEKYEDFWSQIVLLEEIAKVYENNYGYFKANCRYKLEKVDVMDRAEKMQEVDARTLQYISQHPEYLKNAVTGIRYGMQFFLPSKTLMTQKIITNDIYENQVVISFLEYILNEVESLSEKIQEYINLLHTETVADDGYIVSSYLLYANAREVLDEFQNRILELKKQYQKLVASYSKILIVKRVTMAKRPEPSAIFMNLPQYNRIYECILRWFGKTGYDLINERIMISFTHAPAIYEAYVLIKLITQIKEFGYDLIESKLAVYPKQAGWLYKNQNYNNTFVFSNEDSKIILYYEPVIYDEDRRNINGIELYRNNNISLGRDTDDEKKGRYYVPDYIIKYEKDKKIQYLICDAKFSRKTKVQHQIIPDLAYKYLTSISPLPENVSVIGLFIFYGLNEKNNNIESFYNRKIKDGKTIFPRIEMVPLSESVLYSDQTKNALEMLKSLLKYRG